MRTILKLLVISQFLFACVNSKMRAKKIDAKNLSYQDAETIFDYAYPLVLMRISQDLMFTVPLEIRAILISLLCSKNLQNLKIKL